MTMMEAESGYLYDSETSLFEVYKSNRNALLRFAHNLTGCGALAEDIVQDTYLRLPTTPKFSASPKAQLSYIFQIIRNLSVDHHRKRAAMDRLISHIEKEEKTHFHSPEATHQDRQTLSQIDKALSELPKRTRYAFERHRINGVAQKQIAKELEVSTTLVNFMIRDALIHCNKAVHCEH